MACRSTPGNDPEGWCNARIDTLTAALRKAEAEIAALRADLVWAVDCEVASVSEGTSSKRWIEWYDKRERYMDHDDSPDGICAAVRAAREGSK